MLFYLFADPGARNESGNQGRTREKWKMELFMSPFSS
jgi:hypothetical protein